MSWPTQHQAQRAFPRGARAAHDLRLDWCTALELVSVASRDALAMAEGADAAPSGQPGQVLTRLKAALRDLAPDNFPVPGFAPRVLAAAFLAKARAFVQPTGNAPEARTILAAPLAATAEQLDHLVNELRRREAAGWRGRLGEGEG